MSPRYRSRVGAGLMVAGTISIIWGWIQIAVVDSRRTAELTVYPRVFRMAIDKSDQTTHGNHVADAQVTMKNTGRLPITITDIEASCTCTIVEPVRQRSLEPGESRTLNLKVQLPKYGTVRSTVIVRTDRMPEQPAEIVLHLSGRPVIGPYVKHVPDRLQLTVHDVDQPLTYAFSVDTVERLLESERWLTGMNASEPDIKITLTGSEELERMESRQVVVRRYHFELSCGLKEESPRARSFALQLSTRYPAATLPNDGSISVRLSAGP